MGAKKVINARVYGILLTFLSVTKIFFFSSPTAGEILQDIGLRVVHFGPYNLPPLNNNSYININFD